MGVRGVWAYFRRLFTPVHLEGKKTIGIDMLCLIYTYRTAIDELITFIKELQEAGYTILCIWDGVAPKEKQNILNERKSQRDISLEKKETLSAYIEQYGAELDERDLKSLSTAITSLEWQGWHLSYKKKREIQGALGSMEHIMAEGEADDLLLDMAFSGKIDIVMTLDSDLFVMGAPCIWRLLLVGAKTWTLEQIEVEQICRLCNISLGDLQDAAYLAGWDRCHLSGHVYMTFHKAIEHLKTTGLDSLSLILDAESHSRLLQIKSSTHALWKEIFKQRKVTIE